MPRFAAATGVRRLIFNNEQKMRRAKKEEKESW